MAATVDTTETGALNPNARAVSAIHADSGGIAGTSAFVPLDGWDWEQMALVPEAGLQVALPSLRLNPAMLARPRRRLRAAGRPALGRHAPAVRCRRRRGLARGRALRLAAQLAEAGVRFAIARGPASTEVSPANRQTRLVERYRERPVPRKLAGPVRTPTSAPASPGARARP